MKILNPPEQCDHFIEWHKGIEPPKEEQYKYYFCPKCGKWVKD